MFPISVLLCVFIFPCFCFYVQAPDLWLSGTCQAKNKVCPGCNREGATPAHCPCQGKGPVAERKPKKALLVRNPRNCRVKVPFDDRPTPNMENVTFRAMGKSSNPKVLSAYPDTGAEQSMVSEDLVETLGLNLESATKAVEAVGGNRVACLGSSPVEVEYQGRVTQTRLLVTDKLRNEIILSKTVLENLEVIDPDFPNAKVRSRGLQASPGGTLGAGLSQEEGLMSQGPTPKETNEVRVLSMNSNMQDLVSRVIDSLHQAEVEEDDSEKAQSAKI